MEDIIVIGPNGDGVECTFILRGIPAENGDGVEVEITVGRCSWCESRDTENVSVAEFCVGANGAEFWCTHSELCPNCLSHAVVHGTFPDVPCGYDLVDDIRDSVWTIDGIPA